MNIRIKVAIILTMCTFFQKSISAQNDYSSAFAVADNVIENTSFKIVNTETGALFDNTIGLPVSKEFRLECPYNEWHYWNGVLAVGMLRLSHMSGDEKYAQYAVENYNFIFDNLEYFGKQYNGGIRYPSLSLYFEMGLLDHCGAMAAGLCDVYKVDSQGRYRAYLNKAVDYISNDELRFEDKTLIRSWPREMTLWADDLYMSVPFLARMAQITGKPEYMNDAVLQVKNFNKYLFNRNNGLYFHCYFSDNMQNGVAHWGRCNGWVLMAQVELLSVLPHKHPSRKELVKIIEDHIIGLSRHQDYSGMWHQLINKPDSYLESSSTAMFVYGIAKAVNEGLINPSYASIAKNGWEGLSEKIRKDGQVEDICIGTGIEDNIRFYYDRPTKLNDIHGLGAILLAGAEMMRMSELIGQEK